MLFENLRRPLTTTPTTYQGMSGILGFLDSWIPGIPRIVHLGHLATSPLSCALTLKSTGLLAHARAQRLPLVQLCVHLLLLDTVDEQSKSAGDNHAMVRTPYSSLSSRLKWPRTRYSTLATISSSEMSPFSWAMLSLLSSLHNLGHKGRALRLASGGMRQGAGRVHLQSNMPLIDSSCQVSGMLTGDDEAARSLHLKRKKKDLLNLNLEKNVDILNYVSNHNSMRPELVIGFAAETDNI